MTVYYNNSDFYNGCGGLILDSIVGWLIFCGGLYFSRPATGLNFGGLRMIKCLYNTHGSDLRTTSLTSWLLSTFKGKQFLKYLEYFMYAKFWLLENFEC